MVQEENVGGVMSWFVLLIPTNHIPVAEKYNKGADNEGMNV